MKTGLPESGRQRAPTRFRPRRAVAPRERLPTIVPAANGRCACGGGCPRCRTAPQLASRVSPTRRSLRARSGAGRRTGDRRARRAARRRAGCCARRRPARPADGRRWAGAAGAATRRHGGALRGRFRRRAPAHRQRCRRLGGGAQRVGVHRRLGRRLRRRAVPARNARRTPAARPRAYPRAAAARRAAAADLPGTGLPRQHLQLRPGQHQRRLARGARVGTGGAAPVAGSLRRGSRSFSAISRSIPPMPLTPQISPSCAACSTAWRRSSTSQSISAAALPPPTASADCLTDGSTPRTFILVYPKTEYGTASRTPTKACSAVRY